jgi:hypothetical protein
VSIRVLVLAVAVCCAAPASAQEWRFCVGVAPAAHEAVITDIFSSAAESARLEHRLENYFRVRHARALTFQCPRGGSERVAAMNAQTAALQFNRMLGFSVGGMTAAELSSATGEAAY